MGEKAKKPKAPGSPLSQVTKKNGNSKKEIRRALDKMRAGPFLERPAANSSVGRALTSIAADDEAHEKEMRKKLDALYEGYSNEDLNRALFANWPKLRPTYDQHMEETGHTPALRKLIGWLINLDKIGHWKNERLLGERIMELSCGTGTVLDLILDSDHKRRGFFVGNDISPEMLEIAVKKLGEKLAETSKEGVTFVRMAENEEGVGMLVPESRELKVLFTNNPISALKVPEDAHTEDLYDTVILSQTIHLLTDAQKEEAIDRAIALLKEGGTFIVMEEFPGMLSNTTRRPSGFDYIAHYLFRRVFHPIHEKHHLRGVLVGGQKDFSFEMELKECIVPKKKEKKKKKSTSKHSMYCFVFRKKGMKDKKKGKKKIADTVKRAFEVVAPKIKKAGYKEPLKWMLHSRDPTSRKQLIFRKFQKLPAGGKLLVMDEFIGGGRPPARDSRNEHPVDRMWFREELMRTIQDNEFKLRFRAEVAIRMDAESNRRTYGFLYEKVRKEAA